MLLTYLLKIFEDFLDKVFCDKLFCRRSSTCTMQMGHISRGLTGSTKFGYAQFHDAAIDDFSDDFGQLGDYKCTAPFGVITDCNRLQFFS